MTERRRELLWDAPPFALYLAAVLAVRPFADTSLSDDWVYAKDVLLSAGGGALPDPRVRVGLVRVPASVRRRLPPSGRIEAVRRTAGPLRVIEPAERDYRSVLSLQRALAERVAAGEEPDALILVEHDPVVTVGRGGQGREAAARAGRPLVEVERGGGVTYHGPGQLVGYPIVRLEGHDVRGFLRRLEQGLIDFLADQGVAAATIDGATGVWVRERATGESRTNVRSPTAGESRTNVRSPAAGESETNVRSPPARKVASIGIAVRKWVTFHGFALNVSTDLAAFAGLEPCGFDAGVMTSLSREVGRPVSVAEVRAPVARAVAAALGFEARLP